MPDAPAPTWIDSPWLAPFDGSFRLHRARTDPPPGAPGMRALEERLDELGDEIERWQRRLWAEDRRALLLVFQAMDAAGKDSAIKHVFTGVNPQGCHVTSFKAPSANELDHDFLWRHVLALPQRGQIGIHNRSWYEEVLVVRVHPEILAAQKLPWRPIGDTVWTERLESIADLEKHLARNGTIVLKFFLHVGREEQRRRFLSRIEEPAKNWKFEAGDVRERGRWDDYQAAYQAALRATSRPWAPWYAIPADDKAYMRLAVARTLTRTLEGLGLRYPRLSDDEQARLASLREQLLAEDR